MFFVIALVCPPLALLLCLRPISAVINGFFWLLGVVLVPAFGAGLLLVIPCIIHAWSTVSADFANDRNKSTIRELRSLKKELRKKVA